jgi:hypothetical protein
MHRQVSLYQLRIVHRRGKGQWLTNDKDKRGCGWDGDDLAARRLELCSWKY